MEMCDSAMDRMPVTPWGGELVKRLAHHLGAHGGGGAQQLPANVRQVVKAVGVAVSKFQQHVRT